RGRLDDLLDVIQDQQQVAMAQDCRERLGDRSIAALADAQRPGDHRDDQRGIADRRQRYEGDAVGEGVLELIRDLEREPSLANAAGTGQCHEPDVIPVQQRRDCCSLPLSADEGRQGVRQVNGRAAGMIGERNQSQVPGRQTLRVTAVARGIAS
ncbi:MAG: hypothetical protein K0Q71_1914, partial [Thermomicrobiales bacterium]|nr:hypothetical protein [Thermomicrobiales bacterium]